MIRRADQAKQCLANQCDFLSSERIAKISAFDKDFPLLFVDKIFSTALFLQISSSSPLKASLATLLLFPEGVSAHTSSSIMKFIFFNAFT